MLNPEDVVKSDVERLFGKVSPAASAPMARSALAPPLTWAAAMALHDEQCIEYIARVWRFARFLDSDLVALLNEIENSRHAAAMQDVREYLLRPGMSVTITDLTPWAENYWTCYESARRLARYSATYRSTFTPG